MIIKEREGFCALLGPQSMNNVASDSSHNELFTGLSTRSLSGAFRHPSIADVETPVTVSTHTSLELRLSCSGTSLIYSFLPPRFHFGHLSSFAYSLFLFPDPSRSKPGTLIWVRGRRRAKWVTAAVGTSIMELWRGHRRPRRRLMPARLPRCESDKCSYHLPLVLY